MHFIVNHLILRKGIIPKRVVARNKTLPHGPQSFQSCHPEFSITAASPPAAAPPTLQILQSLKHLLIDVMDRLDRPW
jgi:hypothetical protein